MAVKFLNDVAVDSSVLYVDASLNTVGIGTTSPVATLDVTGSGLGAKIHSAQTIGLQVSGGGNSQDIARFQNVSGSTKVTINHAGNVGIGTTNPSYTLDVEGPIRGKQYLYLKDTSGTNRLTIQAESSYVTHSIGALAQNFVANYYRFYDDTLSEMMRIADNGNVGIGTTSPSTTLEVVDTFSVQRTSLDNEGFYVTVSGSNENATVETFYQEDSVSNYGFRKRYDGSTNLYQEFIHNNSATGTEVYRVDRGTANTSIPNGNVGIGTTSPAQKLDVAGDATFDGRIYTNATALDSVGILGKAIANGWAARYDSNNANYSGFFFDANNDASMYLRDDAGNTNVLVRSDSSSYFNGGNVGIGTTSPSEKLHIYNGKAYVTPIAYAANQSAYALKIGAYNSTSFDMGLQAKSTSGGSPYMSFRTSSADDVLTMWQDKVGIGTASPGYKLDVNGDVRITQDNQLILSRSGGGSASSDSCIYVDNTFVGGGNPYNIDSDVSSYFGSRHIGFRYNGTIVGSIAASGTTAVTYNTTSSDERLKKNIEDWQDNILDKFEQIEPKKFNFITEADGTDKTKGFIAQEMFADFPEAYPHDYSEEKYYSFNPSGMVVYLMKAVKELVEKNKELENRLQVLENK